MNAAKGALAALCVAALMACGDDDDDTVTFTVPLGGSNEVPAVVTAASGTATIRLIEGETVNHTVAVTGLSGPATAAHIHVGAIGAEGPPVYTFNAAALASGTLADGNLVAANLTISMDSLITLILNGNAYVNVHTTANPDGEIRGQINP